MPTPGNHRLSENDRKGWLEVLVYDGDFKDLRSRLIHLNRELEKKLKEIDPEKSLDARDRIEIMVMFAAVRSLQLDLEGGLATLKKKGPGQQVRSPATGPQRQ